jgi:hypothetical protein
MNAIICKKDFDTDSLTKEFSESEIFNSADSLIKSEKRFNSIFLNGYNEKDIVSIIKLIRRSQYNFAVPVFTDCKLKNEVFSDGIFLDIEKTNRKIEEVNSYLVLLKHGGAATWKNKLLVFLFCRPEEQLIPDTDISNPIYYYYPLVELFYEGSENYFYWLDDLAEQNILQKKELKDRIFTCPYCFSARLRFTDHCPYCNSINIRQGDFLHCFTCGLVAPQEDFIKSDRLVCPRCNSKLKHVGEDYDRPLESGVCLDCGEYHIDSKLVSYCVDCEKYVETDNLNKRSVYDYKVSDFGRNQIQFNSIDILPIFVDSINYVTLEYFHTTLDWLIKMHLRYDEEVFSLLGMKTTFSGESTAYELIVMLGKHLRKTLRNTDLCTRLKDGYFWFLLPKTSKEGLGIIENRLREFVDNVDSSVKDDLMINLVGFTSNKLNIDKKTSKLLIAELSSEL